MRTLHNYLDAAKQRREDGEAGFSLIELIVVVAILGILVAIAIPVFGAIQDTAKENAVKTVAANGATSVAAQIANNDTISLTKLNKDGFTVTSTGTTLDTVCVTASKDGKTATSGPGCP